MLAANDCRVVFTFLQRSPSFSLASASGVRHDNESWHARQRAYLLTPTTWTRTTVELVRGLMCSCKKTRTTTLLVSRFWFVRSFFIKSRAGEFSRSLRQPQQTTEFFVFQQSFYWTRRFDPETRAFFGYTSKLSKQIHLYFFVAQLDRKTAQTARNFEKQLSIFSKQFQARSNT